MKILWRADVIDDTFTDLLIILMFLLLVFVTGLKVM